MAVEPADDAVAVNVSDMARRGIMAVLLDERQKPGTSDGVVGSNICHDREFAGERHVATDKATEERLKMVSKAHILVGENIP
jgi:hypothetical protein